MRSVSRHADTARTVRTIPVSVTAAPTTTTTAANPCTKRADISPCCRTRGRRPEGLCRREHGARASCTYGGRECADVVGAVVALAVDEERRRARDAAQVGAVDVLGHPGGPA